MSQSYEESRHTVELALRVARIARAGSVYPSHERLEALLTAERSAWVREFGSAQLKKLHLQIAPGTMMRTYAEQWSGERQNILSGFREKFELEWVARTHPGWRVEPLNHPEDGKTLLTVSANADLEASIRGRCEESIHPKVTLIDTPPIDELLKTARTTVPDATIAVRRFLDGPAPDELHPRSYPHYALAERRVPGDERASAIVLSPNERQLAASAEIYESQLTPLMRLVEGLEAQYGAQTVAVPQREVAGKLVSVTCTERSSAHAVVATPPAERYALPVLYVVRVPQGEERRLQALVGTDVTLAPATQGVQITPAVAHGHALGRLLDEHNASELLVERIKRVTGRPVRTLPEGKFVGYLHSIECADRERCRAILVTERAAHILSVPREHIEKHLVGESIAVGRVPRKERETAQRAVISRVPDLGR